MHIVLFDLHSFVIKLIDTCCEHCPCTGVWFSILVADVYQLYGGPCRAMEAKFRAIKNTLGDPLLYFVIVSFTAPSEHISTLNSDVLIHWKEPIRVSPLFLGQSRYHWWPGEIPWTMRTLFSLLRRKLNDRLLWIDSLVISITERCLGRCGDRRQCSGITTKNHVQFGAGEENSERGWHTHRGRPCALELI